MKISKLAIVGIFAVVAALLASASMFTVRQTEQAIVVQFGNPREVIRQPGLHFKIPFIQQVLTYDSRILSLNPRGQEVPLIDQKRIIVDSFARYRIVDPLQFFKSVVTIRGFESRFGPLLNSAVRDNLGSAQLADLLTEKRGTVMQAITETMRLRASEFGVEVIDVRIGRTDLPPQTSQSVFDRMRSSRIALAKQLRAEGEEQKLKIQAEADRDRTVMLAEARKTSEGLRGQGDAQRNTILADAYNRDPEFFRFYRSLDAYRQALDSNTTMVLSPESEFFRYFNSLPGGKP